MSTITSRKQIWGSAALVSVIFAGSFIALDALTTGGAPYLACCLAALIALAVEYARRDKLHRLYADLSLARPSSECTIRINGAIAGVIAEPDYIQLRIQSILDPINYVRQFMEGGRVFVNGVVLAAVAMPVVLFWLVLLMAAFVPEHLVANLAPLYRTLAVASVNASALHALGLVAQTLLTIGGTLWVVYIGIQIFLAKQMPVRNVFQQSVGERLRRHCGSMVKGDVDIWIASARGSVIREHSV